MPDIGQTKTRKVLRWAIRLSLYNYVCIHISGNDSVWADLMNRWTIAATIRRLVIIPPLPFTFTVFDWPTVLSLRYFQDDFVTSRPASARELDGL